MKNLTTRLVAASGAFAITLGAAACSKSDTPTAVASSSSSSTGGTNADATPKASDILAQAKTNALAAKSAAFAGTVVGNGQSASINLKGTADGKETDVTIVRSGVGRARFIAFKGEMYMQGDAAFWRLQKAPAKVIAAPNKFVRMPTSARAIAGTLALEPMLAKIFSVVTPDQLATSVSAQTVDGVDCWVITDKKGQAEGALYVSKDTFQVVRFTGSKSSPGQLDFSSWNADLGIKAPPANQVMTLS